MMGMDPNAPVTLEQATKYIQDEVKSYSTYKTGDVSSSGTVTATYPTCAMTADENCSLTNFANDVTSLVQPGGETACIFEDSGPFQFQVIKGASDKVLIHFQGGGACFDEISSKMGFCTTSANPYSQIGVFDRTNPTNPYKDATVIVVLYCSGDLHAGDITRPYKVNGGSVVQKGLANTQATLDWIKSQQDQGLLASPLQELTVMGCSAGSLGTQVWADEVLKQIPAVHAAVAPDSYAGVFPEGTQGPLIRGYGMCPWVNSHYPTLSKSCWAGTLTIQDMVDTQMSAIEKRARGGEPVPYGYWNSKADYVQQSFYIAVGVLSHFPPSPRSEDEATDMMMVETESNKRSLRSLGGMIGLGGHKSNNKHANHKDNKHVKSGLLDLDPSTIGTHGIQNATSFITPALYYEQVNEIFERYSKHPSFVSYLIDGPKHCFSDQTEFYTATTFGPLGGANRPPPPLL